MDVKISKLYETFLYAQKVGFDYGVTFSLRSSPKLKEFLDDLDPELPLDWSAKSFYGMPELRQRVIETQGYHVSIENTLITAGTNEAIFLVLTQTISPGDEVVMDNPSWPQVYELSSAYGAKIKIVKRREELDWGIDLDELNDAVTPNTRLIFVNSPNNPTGAVFSEEEMKQICEIARANDAYLLSDEVYRNLELEGPRSPAAVNYYEKAISAASVSKTLGLQGIRTGWMATQDMERERSDVVHDLLAFLAEEMTRLHEEKQVEIKGFLGWLESYLGISVEDLRNKTKVKEYWKTEVGWDGFLGALQQNKNAIQSAKGIDVTRREPQKNARGEFDASVAKLGPLLEHIDLTDKLIDQIVYKLYGLNEAEIAVVEGRG